MDVNPTRFAVAATAALACVIVGLLVGMRAGGGSSTDHVLRIERTTTLAAPQRADAAARTVTATVTRAVSRTLTRTVKVPVTITAAAPAARPAPPPGSGGGDGQGKGPGHDGGAPQDGGDGG